MGTEPIVAVWYEGETDIECDIQQVAAAFDDPGVHYAGVVGLMPGMTTVELVDQGTDSVTIKTNEGLMQRRNISREVTVERIVVECNEEYDAGSKVTATSHFSEEFTPNADGVRYRLVISDMKAPGALGFLYRRFGSSNIGEAFLKAYKADFEKGYA